MKQILKTPIEYLKGIGTERAKLLNEELGLKNYNDLLQHLPFRYVDKSKFYKVNELTYNQNSEIQTIGEISSLKEVSQKRGKRLVATFSDETGAIELIWFKTTKWLIEKLQNQLKQKVIVYGKVTAYNGKLNMTHPEIEDFHESRKDFKPFLPVYSSTEKLQKKSISNRVFQRLQFQLLSEVQPLQENLSKTILDTYNLIDRNSAFKEVHFPSNIQTLQKAQIRLKFEEFFFFQFGMFSKKVEHQKKYKSFAFETVGHYFHSYYQNHLQFELTNAQKRVIKEIRSDLKMEAQMNRLLQGDVGSGKTVVALLSMLIALDNDFQAMLIAPTEILAQQHYNSIENELNQLNIKVDLLTGSTPKAHRKTIHTELQNGTLKILIGTHAILEDTVQFKNLGLAIVDEQHKFGVAQRAKLYKKNTLAPHVLVMTATPIPRTLAMTAYGDLSLSVIDELPVGRKPVKTIHRKDRRRLEMFQFIKEQIELGRQAYVVYPLIEESKTLDYKDLTDGYESIIRAFPLPKYKVSILHGKMKPEDKAYEMERFVKGETQIMVSTTVIEVGVNVPNASVMVIENSEKFGLSQLHQLRGRVGRGAEQSYCILMTKDTLNEKAQKRIHTMCNTNDGFRIAEVDLELRGPGDLMGTQQSGILNFKIGNLVKDKAIIELSRRAVEELIQNDQNLEHEENKNIKSFYIEYHQNKIAWSRIG